MVRTAHPGRPLGHITREIQTLSDAFLAVRVLGWALVLPGLKRVLSVRSLAAIMHRDTHATSRDADRERRIVTFARWGARLARWKSGGNCLERGLIAYRYLGEVGARPTLVVGVGRDASGVTGHAWVLVDGQLVGERPSSIQPYTPMFAFGPDGRLDADSLAPPYQTPAS